MKCIKQVRIAGMVFPRYHRCSRDAMGGTDTCKQHSPEAKALREKKAEVLNQRKRKLHLAYIHSKNSK